MKFELKARSPNESISTRHCPENIINVTIINESKQKENVKPSESSKEVQTTESQSLSQSQLTSSANSAAPSRRRKLSKRLLLLPKHVKTRKTNIVHKKGTAEGVDDGVLVRNTPADLYQKYQNDWNKFKSLIPGESTRRDVRESVRSKMHQKVDEPPKVSNRSNLVNEPSCFNPNNAIFIDYRFMFILLTNDKTK